ncbi:hypothetical protein JCM19239_7189 [Vibrio variabilis]|uniref:Uncharacterized protein n=1 Tax=Vibrio variabilis TaxID=990271 RepID=A0ABQ0JK71_9VIBR|nr:hypothetical protein JCM19239_7189 [Vibrio variabilis]
MKNTRIISIMALSALLFTGAAKAHSPESDLKFRGGLGYSSLKATIQQSMPQSVWS